MLLELEGTQAQDYLDWVQRMVRKGYRTKADLIEARSCLERAKFGLEQAKTRLDVLERVTKPRESARFDAAVEDLKVKAALWQQASEKEAELKRQAEQARLSPGEARALALLDEALGLHEQGHLEQAQGKLREAARLWRSNEPNSDAVRLGETRRRISQALQDQARRK